MNSKANKEGKHSFNILYEHLCIINMTVENRFGYCICTRQLDVQYGFGIRAVHLYRSWSLIHNKRKGLLKFFLSFPSVYSLSILLKQM